MHAQSSITLHTHSLLHGYSSHTRPHILSHTLFHNLSHSLSHTLSHTLFIFCYPTRWVLLENILETLDAALEPILLQQKFKQGGQEMMKVQYSTVQITVQYSS